MPLPYSRNTTYAPGDEVLSADLNAMQDAAAAGHAAMLGALTYATQTAWAPAAGGADIAHCPNSKTTVMAATPASAGNIVIQWAGGWNNASGTASSFTPISATGSSVPSVATNGAGGWVVGFSPSSASTTRIFYSTNYGQAFTSAALTVSSSNKLVIEWDGLRFVAIDTVTLQCWSSSTGATWAAGSVAPAGLRVTSGSPGNPALATDGAGTMVGTTSTHLHRTTDGGATWAQVVAIPGGTPACVAYDSSAGRFAYCSSSGIYWLNADLSVNSSVLLAFPGTGPTTIAAGNFCRGAFVFVDTSIPNRGGVLPPGKTVAVGANFGASSSSLRVGPYGAVMVGTTAARFSGPLY